MQKNNQKGRDIQRLWTMQQQTRAIRIARAEPQKAQMIKKITDSSNAKVIIFWYLIPWPGDH